MKTCKIYGLDYSLINFVKNELTKNNSVQSKSVFIKAKKIFTKIEFDVIDISDLLYHLSKS
jgi:hypothetical protein